MPVAMQTKKITHVLFDLDGTLLDTAPDLAFTINTLLEAHQRPPLSLMAVRPFAGHGAAALIKLGFDIETDHPQFAKLWQDFLTIYRANLCKHTQLFPHIDQVLTYLAHKELPWGIVTNKLASFTEPLLTQLNLDHKPSCIISGDTLDKQKPDPAPLLHACTLMQAHAENCVYIGDAERDIQAGNAAGMHTLIAQWGYISDDEPCTQWRADGMLEKPADIIAWLEQQHESG